MTVYSPDQLTAVAGIDLSMVVTAGAGSGKTTVLVGRYLNLIAAGAPVDSVVAITFTRKAAAEMSARVREQAEKRVNDPDLDPQARAHLRRALQDLSAARIGTIHSLCGDIVRANAAVCGLDPSFSVLDEIESKLVFRRAFERALNRWPTEQDPHYEAVIAVLGAYKPSQIEKALTAENLAQMPDALDEDLTEAQLAERLGAAYKAEVQLLLGELLRSDEVRAVDGYTLPSGVKGADSDKLVMRYHEMRHALSQLRQSASVETFWQCFTSLTSSCNVGSKTVWPDVEEAKTVARALVSRVKQVGERLSADPTDSQVVRWFVGWRALARRVRQVYQEAKRRQNVLDFNDLERYAARVLADDAVAERYQQQFRQVMVDEFQDTSTAQWEIIRRIAPPERAGSLFIVGDPKQSIYGFRGADHRVFVSAQTLVKSLSLGGRVVALNTSYRTHAALVETLNTLFAAVMPAPPEASPEAGYVPFEALRAHRDVPPAALAPHLRVQMLDVKLHQDSGAIKDKDEGRLHEAAHIARTIAEMVQQGAVSYGKVALLLRSRTHMKVYEQALKNAGIPFITYAGGGYFNQPEVQDVLSVLKALYNTRDDLALAAALRSPLFNLSDAALYALRRADKSADRPALWQALTGAPLPEGLSSDDHAAALFARTVLTELQTRTRRVRVASILVELIERTGYLAVLESMSDGRQARANVQKLLELAENTGVVTLSRFNQYIQQRSADDAREAEVVLEAGDVVQIMTIHASKGLEFEVVFLPDSSDEGSSKSVPKVLPHPLVGLAVALPEKDSKKPDLFPFDGLRQLEQERETAEALRVFYVAATRAKDLLIVTGAARSPSGRMKWLTEQKAVLEAAGVRYEDVPLTPDLSRLPPLSAPKVLPLSDEVSAPLIPPLMKPLNYAPLDEARQHISTTHLAYLSQSRGALSDEVRARARQRFRRGFASQTVDTPIPFLTGGLQERTAPAYVVGEVVHEAIRFGYDGVADEMTLRRLLRGLVWSQAISPELHDDAVERAVRLLYGYRKSQIYREVNSTSAVWREIPFVYPIDNLIIHGQIDLLYRIGEHDWHVVDYKTDWIDFDPIPSQVSAHSTQHTLQLAVYTRAVQQRLAHLPDAVLHTHVHYIRHNVTHTFEPAVLDNALRASNLRELIKDNLADALADV